MLCIANIVIILQWSNCCDFPSGVDSDCNSTAAVPLEGDCSTQSSASLTPLWHVRTISVWPFFLLLFFFIPETSYHACPSDLLIPDPIHPGHSQILAQHPNLSDLLNLPSVCSSAPLPQNKTPTTTALTTVLSTIPFSLSDPPISHLRPAVPAFLQNRK